MFEIRLIDDPDVKTAVTLRIMHSLPKWFSPPEDVDRKSVAHRELPFFAAYDGGEPVGFTALKIHNRFAAEIYGIGVLESFQRRKAGSLMIGEAVKYCAVNNHSFLTVKTLDESAGYAPYDGTRAFYEKMGFFPLEVFKNFWDEENPCLFLIKIVGGGPN